MDVDSLNIAEYSKARPRRNSVEQSFANKSEPVKSMNNNLKRKNPVEARKISEFDEKHKNAVEKAIEDANKLLYATKKKLAYTTHEKTNRLMVTVVNVDTEEVIREIPPEKLLDAYAQMLELAGLLVDKRS